MQVEQEGYTADRRNPLSNRTFYRDTTRAANVYADRYRADGNLADAALMNKIASQPGATWLVGPSPDDPSGARDIAAVERTSREAAAQGTVPIYQLYALPGRDACAAYSKGGFQTEADYLAWLEKILGTLHTDAVINIEADSIAQTINSTCMSAAQAASRYALLRKVASRLHNAPHVLAAYLDAGHPDWISDPQALVSPLQKSGIEYVRGVVVNVSFFADTTTVTTWSQQLVGMLGGNKGVLIDTSRNGKGILQASGDARWCNPAGRGLGPRPTTIVADASIDAYFWGKNSGESDGNCAGNPPAGVFVPALALELARGTVE